jgi:DNA-binding CsgD family transcriptional regulator
MPEGRAVAGSATPGSAEPDSLVASNRRVRDLAALLALPAMWLDQEPAHIATGLLGVLCSVLNLESAYVRFDDPAGGPALARWRPDGPAPPAEFQPVLSAGSAREQGVVTARVAATTSDGTLRVTSMSPALPGEYGLVLVSSRRDDFPTETEVYLLRVAVGQAMMSIHTARRLAGERAARVAAEAALARRNAFLATLAGELAAPLATLAERAAEAHAFATEPDQATGRGGEQTEASGTADDAADAVWPQASGPSFTLPVRLTRREAEVLGLLAQGLSNREIAGVLWLSERTVERHITGLYRKIGVERRSEATAYALRHHLVDAGSIH